MDEKKEPKVLLECPLKFVFREEGCPETAGEAEARLTEEALTIKPRFGAALYYTLRDIADLVAVDYRLELFFASGESLSLYHLGYKYDDFTRLLSGLRNEMLLKDLLMQESLRHSGFQGHCSVTGPSGEKTLEGMCDPRLYETALVVLPERGDPLRVSYSFIDRVEEGNYTLTVYTELGETIVFSRLGRSFAPFTEALSQLMNELSLKVQASLKELLPEAAPAVIRKAARFMREGTAAARGQLESIAPELWTELEKKLESAGIRHEYDFLSRLALTGKMCIGVKRGLLGDFTGEYTWFLIPMGDRENGPNNAVAMEASSGKGGGRATYFFRLTGREDFLKLKNAGELDTAVDAFIARLNRAMLAVNFRREPIYLPAARFDEPRYQKYRAALRKLPALQELRRLFVGRVFHRSPEQWEQEVTALLKFNSVAADEELPWTRGAAGGEGLDWQQEDEDVE